MNKFEERAAKMNKAAIEKMLADIKDGFLTVGPEYQAALDARLVSLTPKKNAEYPQQAALYNLIKQRDGLNEQIKQHVTAAKAGGYSFKTEVGGRTQNTGRASAGGNGPHGMRGTGHKKNVMKITVNGTEYGSWVEVAVAHNVSPERLADPEKKNKTNWRKYVCAAGLEGTVAFTEDGAEMKAAYIAEKWLDGSKFQII